jgi:predicted DNA-binding ribbon-helix-helix protein
MVHSINCFLAMQKSKSIPRGVRLNTATWHALEKMALARGTSLGAVIRQIVNEKLAQN